MTTAKINNWTAKPGKLEVVVWIEPWSRAVYYHREYTSVMGSYASHWRWIEGSWESGQTSHTNAELSAILDDLTLEHEVLSLVAHKYGIEVETDA